MAMNGFFEFLDSIFDPISDAVFEVGDMIDPLIPTETLDAAIFFVTIFGAPLATSHLISAYGLTAVEASAAVGAAKSAIAGGDPITGALTGGTFAYIDPFGNYGGIEYAPTVGDLPTVFDAPDTSIYNATGYADYDAPASFNTPIDVPTAAVVIPQVSAETVVNKWLSAGLTQAEADNILNYYRGAAISEEWAIAQSETYAANLLAEKAAADAAAEFAFNYATSQAPQIAVNNWVNAGLSQAEAENILAYYRGAGISDEWAIAQSDIYANNLLAERAAFEFATSYTVPLTAQAHADKWINAGLTQAEADSILNYYRGAAISEEWAIAQSETYANNLIAERATYTAADVGMGTTAEVTTTVTDPDDWRNVPDIVEWEAIPDTPQNAIPPVVPTPPTTNVPVTTIAAGVTAAAAVANAVGGSGEAGAPSYAEDLSGGTAPVVTPEQLAESAAYNKLPTGFTFPDISLPSLSDALKIASLAIPFLTAQNANETQLALARQGINPLTGKPYTVATINPQTGLPYAAAINPLTGAPYVEIDPLTGAPYVEIDPLTGKPVTMIDKVARSLGIADSKYLLYAGAGLLALVAIQPAKRGEYGKLRKRERKGNRHART